MQDPRDGQTSGGVTDFEGVDMPSLPTITEFLEARIAEDETEARRLYIDLEAEIAESYPDSDEKGLFTPERLLSAQMWAHYDGQSKRRSFAKGQQIAKLANPSRVLAVCAAKRAIMDRYQRFYATRRANWMNPNYAGAMEELKFVLETLAAAYKDHPDYRQEWAIG